MSQERYRTIGAVAGLSIGIAVMVGLGLGGVLPAALFGAGGCVAGAMAGEKLFAWNRGRDS